FEGSVSVSQVFVEGGGDIMVPLCALLITFLFPSAEQAIESPSCVHVLIPSGMPIKIHVHKDESESEIQKYVIDRTVSSDVRRARITTVMLDENGMIKFKRSREGDHLNDPMSIATADTSVARILLIVEWLETDK